MTTADYVVAMEKTCNCDLDWFFDQWAYGIGYPKVHFTRHWAADLKTLHVVVTQTQLIDSLHPTYRFPATIRVITRDSVVRKSVMVAHQTDTFAIALPSAPLSFRFDEGGWLLGTVTGDLTPAELADMAKHDLDIRGRQWALDQLAGSHDAVAAEARRFVAPERAHRVAARGGRARHDPGLERGLTVGGGVGAPRSRTSGARRGAGNAHPPRRSGRASRPPPRCIPPIRTTACARPRW